jgi:hypothetical protein
MSALRLAAAGLVAAGALAFAQPAAASHQCGWVNTVKIKANDNTSCPFAKNIARSWLRGLYNGNFDAFSDNSVSGRVYSPVTGRTYTMRCSRLYNGGGSYTVWGCYGGNSAYAKLTYFAE